MNIKFLFRYYLRFFILSYIFVFSCDIVFATNKPSHPNLFDKCTLENKCIPICIYGYENSDGEVIDSAFIGYFYDIDRKSTDPLDDIWVFGHFLPNQKNKEPYYFNDLLGDTIGWFEKGEDKPFEWYSTHKDYLSLINNFKCPMFYDGSKNETNTAGNYDTLKEYGLYNKIFSNDWPKGYQLTYSFSEELGKVLDITYYNMKDILLDNLGSLHSNPDFISYGSLASMSGFPKENELEILSMHDSNIKYSSNLSYEENLKQNKICEYFNGKDTSSYISELVELSNSEHLYADKIHEKIKFVANNIDVRNKGVYDDYFNLRFLIDYNSKTVLNSNKHNGKTFTTKNGFVYDMAYDRLNVMLTVPPKKAFDNVINSCKSLYSSYDFSNLDSSEVFDEYTTQMESILYKKNAVIDLESTFDCGTFFSGNLAKMIGNAYFIIEIGSLLIFIALSILDYAKVILNGDQDEMKKTNKNTIIRLIIVVSLFLLPAIINFVLGIFNIEGFDSEHPLCVEIKNK